MSFKRQKGLFELLIKNVKIIGENEITDGFVRTANGKITEVGKASREAENEEVIDGNGKYLSPGFIDLHVHGGGGYSAMGTPEDIVKMATAHMNYGTTSILPTTLAAPIAQLKTALLNIKEAKRICKTSNILGAHLEGPFLSPEMCGAQSPENILVPSQNEYESLLDLWDGLKIMGAAPETDGGMVLGEELKKRGIVASIAHSSGDYDTAKEAIKHGYSDVTHLYNACTSCYKRGIFRRAGTVEAALTHDELTAQVIADLCHLPLGVLKLIYRCKGADKMYLITDGLEYSATETKEGTLVMQKNGVPAIYEDGVMKLADRSCIAGSVATTDRLVRNMYKMVGVPLCDAVKMASLTPARVIGIDSKKGKIEKDFDADLIMFDDDINISFVMVGGSVVKA